MKKITRVLSALPLSLIICTSPVSAGLINEDFNSGLPATATLFGAASIVSNEVQLTPSSNGQLGGLSFSDQDSGAAITAWSAAFDFRIDQNSARPADGISLSFSRLGDVGAVGEEGRLTGIAVGFDTFSNAEVSSNHLSLRYDGILLEEIDISSVIFSDGTLFGAEITLNNGLIEVLIDGSSLLSHNITGWSAYAGQYNFGARTGGFNSRQIIDNFVGSTTAEATVPAPATLALFGLGLAGLGWSKRKKA